MPGATGQVDRLVATVGIEVECGRQWVIGWHRERRAIGEHPARTTQAELADRQQVTLQFQFGETLGA